VVHGAPVDPLPDDPGDVVDDLLAGHQNGSSRT
jgi:hypothetical protein